MSCPDPKQVLTPQTLTQLIQLVNLLPLGPLYTAVFLLAFHGFFRISNLLPLTGTAFQPSSHLTRGDVSITTTGVTVFIKWTKTLQASRNTHHIPLASIPGSPLCPRQAIISLCNAYPVYSQAPMFSYMCKGKLTILTQLQVRTVLSQTLTSMGLNPKDFGFHTFRRSGASLAFSLNVPVQYIKPHLKSVH